ncbi:serine/threonine protein kinase, partial [Myxococcota bacterium]|nr:serine/threonine protein kinase [Myxococcota bacterium]
MAVEHLPRVFGDYVLVERLGQGAAGDVFLARPLRPRREVPNRLVIKRLHGEHANEQEFVRRFRHEAEIAVCIDSPHVAKVYTVGAAGGTLYIAMEHVSGMPLSKLLTVLSQNKRQIPIPVAVELVAGALAGLDAMHSARDASGRPLGFIHRDVSPKNMMVDDDGTLRLIDLGFGKSNVQDWKTGTGIVLGSIGYMAPEQIRAQPLDLRCDLYALGIILFEMLTLRRYIKPDVLPAMVAQSLTQGFLPPSQFRADVPRAFDDVVRRATAHELGARFQSASEFLAALRSVPVEPCPKRQVAELVDSAFGTSRAERLREIDRLLAVPLEDDPPEHELTRVDVFAQRTVAAVIPSLRTEPQDRQGAPRAPALAPEHTPTELRPSPSDRRRRGINEGEQVATVATTIAPRDASGHAPTTVKTVHDRTRLLPRPGSTRADVPDSAQFAQPMGSLAVSWAPPPSLFAGRRLWIVLSLIVIAVAAGVAGGILIAGALGDANTVVEAVPERAAVVPAEPTRPLAAAAAQTS